MPWVTPQMSCINTQPVFSLLRLTSTNAGLPIGQTQPEAIGEGSPLIGPCSWCPRRKEGREQWEMRDTTEKASPVLNLTEMQSPAPAARKKEMSFRALSRGTFWNAYPQRRTWMSDSQVARLFHSSTLAWRIPWAEEPGGLQSMGSLRLRHD